MRSMVEGAKHRHDALQPDAARRKAPIDNKVGACNRPLHRYAVPLPRTRGRI